MVGGKWYVADEMVNNMKGRKQKCPLNDSKSSREMKHVYAELFEFRIRPTIKLARELAHNY